MIRRGNAFDQWHLQFLESSSSSNKLKEKFLMTPRNFHISIYSNARSQFFRWRQNVVFRRVANILVNVLWLGVFSHEFDQNLRQILVCSILLSWAYRRTLYPGFPCIPKRKSRQCAPTLCTPEVVMWVRHQTKFSGMVNVFSAMTFSGTTYLSSRTKITLSWI